MRASRILPTALASAVAFLATSPVALLAQEHGAEGAAEPSLFDINTGLSVWTLVVFAGLLFLLGKFAWGPILAAVDAREKGIQGALDQAAARQAEAEKLLDEHRRQLADARRQAGEILAEGRAAGDRVRKEIEEKARAEASTIVERAKQDIERERDAALEMLRRESVELALAAASRLMHEHLDQAKDRQLVERFLDEMAEGRGAPEAQA
jgi:F-type H+-transporting ATPase subunit b